MHNILVCDDDRDIVAALKIYLSGGEYRVFEAYNGAEAVEAVRKNDIHLVLMDIMMPVMDGLEATRRIRTCTHPRGATVPIIAISANAFADDIQKAKNAGMNEHLAKPFELEKVLRAISRYHKE